MSPSTRRVWIEIFDFYTYLQFLHVTLHTEGVDWNGEIQIRTEHFSSHPPHGGCGLKFSLLIPPIFCELSPSTRRVWIEILKISASKLGIDVTLHTEGVDWNRIVTKPEVQAYCHPPHGGCGLKFSSKIHHHLNYKVADCQVKCNTF